jgi:hypothetical protein
MQALTVLRQNMLRRLTLVLALALPSSARAEDSFTKGLSPADVEAAGLGKLTPDELARLDALVRGQQTGAVKKAKEETAKAVSASVREQVQAEDRKAAAKQGPGVIDRMKVLLKPGTEIEYTTLDSMLVLPFDGWRKGTLITLTNGQRWVVTDSDHYWVIGQERQPRHVKIVPGSMGSFFMDIEGAGRPRVKFVGSSPSPAPAQGS